MAYIGKTPVLGNFVKLDAITVVNGQAAYTMQNGGVNFTDYTTVNQFLVSLNGTIQAATDSFTVSGSTITFASNLSTGDVIDFIIVFGNSLSAGTVSDSAITTAKLADSSVTTAKLNDASVSLAKLTATGTKDATTFLRGDNTFAAAGLNGWSENGSNNDLLPTNASAGIYLGVTSATASNLLNDYEFGTWTPAVTGSPSGSYTYQYGNYTKINKMVYITGFVQGNLSGGTGSAKISGLPFTPDSGSNVYYEPVTIGFTYGLGTTLYQAFFQADATEFFLLGEPSSGARTHVNTSAIVSSDFRISFSGFYNTAA